MQQRNIHTHWQCAKQWNRWRIVCTSYCNYPWRYPVIKRQTDIAGGRYRQLMLAQYLYPRICSLVSVDIKSAEGSRLQPNGLQPLFDTAQVIFTTTRTCPTCKFAVFSMLKKGGGEICQCGPMAGIVPTHVALGTGAPKKPSECMWGKTARSTRWSYSQL